jgi:CheY-like chemotaxis protein
MPSILLVSDAVDERQVHARALRAGGYRVVTTATTVAAYQIATTRPPDMVVTDVHCARSMSGLELARRLRIHTRTTTVPIIVLTSKMRRQDGELSLKAGADMFLEKPVSGDVLRDNVVRLLFADGRLSRRRSPGHELPGFVEDNAARDRTCPQCGGLMEYRHNAPVLSPSELNSRQPRDRLRYVLGWFCSDPSCEYQELGPSRE